MTRPILQDFPADVANKKAGRLEGDFKGTAGFIKTADGGFNDATFAINELASDADPEKVLVWAVLPQPIEIPAGLITHTNLSQRRLWAGTGDIEKELGQFATAVRNRFLAHRRECLRRLRAIKIEWGAGRFLDASGSVKLPGEAKLAGAFSRFSPTSGSSTSGRRARTRSLIVRRGSFRPPGTFSRRRRLSRVSRSGNQPQAPELGDVVRRSRGQQGSRLEIWGRRFFRSFGTFSAIVPFFHWDGNRFWKMPGAFVY